MKKICLILLMSLIICGCTNIASSNYNEIIKNVLSQKINISNTYRNGYKYYIPREMRSIRYSDFNETITDNKTNYYLYIDLVSYYNKATFDYKDINDNNVIPINHKDKSGYLTINKKNDKYLVEMMYNYAKIEVIVDSKNINQAILNSITILSSIKYNRKIINNIIGDDILNTNESDYSIFEKNKDNSEFIHYEEIYDNYEEEIPDMDLIN